MSRCLIKWWTPKTGEKSKKWGFHCDDDDDDINHDAENNEIGDYSVRYGVMGRRCSKAWMLMAAVS